MLCLEGRLQTNQTSKDKVGRYLLVLSSDGTEVKQ